MTDNDVQDLVRLLIGETPIEVFEQEIREVRPQRIEDAFPKQALEELLSLARVETLLGEETVLPSIDVFSEGHLKRLSDMQRKSGKSGLEVALDCFRQGSTIRIRDIDRFDSRLDRFTAGVERLFAARAQANLYLAPPASAGFPAHFDITDVFVVQCAGTKEWTIHPEYTNQSDLPLPSTDWDPDRFQALSTCDRMTLKAGDVLYLPRGVMHQASCQEHESMHLTISLAPLVWAELLIRAVRVAAESNVELRQRVPWPTPAPGGDIPSLLPNVRRRLVHAIEELDMDALLSEERESWSSGGSVRRTSKRLESAIADMLEAVGRRPSERAAATTPSGRTDPWQP